MSTCTGKPVQDDPPTSRRLILMRHGEADAPAEPGMEGDYQRPLTQRGVSAVREMAAWLAQQQWRPERILCSPAQRTRETAELIRQGLHLSAASEQPDRRLYLAEEATILAVLAEQPARCNNLMLVGHNPALAGLIARFAQRQTPVPPATLALFEAHTPDWQFSGQPLHPCAINRPGHDLP